MATVNLGNIKFNWKGAYNGSTAYVVDDVVSNSGSSYICILASTGNAPTNTTYWQQMSAAGTNGTDIGTTITTQGDLLYRDGSGNYASFENGNGTQNNSWNREHVWPKSHGFPDQDDIAYTDVHNLKPADRSVNSSRGTKDYDFGGCLLYTSPSPRDQRGAGIPGCG